MDEEAELFTEAYENMLDSIVTVVDCMSDADKQAIATPVASMVVDSFIRCHIAPPDGIRKASELGSNFFNVCN